MRRGVWRELLAAERHHGLAEALGGACQLAQQGLAQLLGRRGAAEERPVVGDARRHALHRDPAQALHVDVGAVHVGRAVGAELDALFSRSFTRSSFKNSPNPE